MAYRMRIWKQGHAWLMSCSCWHAAADYAQRHTTWTAAITNAKYHWLHYHHWQTTR